MNSNNIAVITPSEKSFKAFIMDIHSTNLNFIRIDDYNQMKGRKWDGYVRLHDFYLVENPEAIEYTINQRIKIKI